MWTPQKAPFRKYKKEVFRNVIKTADFIYQIGEYQELRNPSKLVSMQEIHSLHFKRKVEYLKKCLLKYRKLTGVGRGITGVQVGMPERFSVIYMPEVAGELLVIINPVITKQSKELLEYPEICMSANPIIAPVIRPAWIEFEYLTIHGEKQLWNMKDSTKNGQIYNRVLQHEIDHMDGIINIDKVESKKLIFESDPKFYDNSKFTKIKT